MSKLQIDEHESVNFRDSKKSLANEIASRTRAFDFYSMGMFLPDPDPVLKAQGKDLKIYRGLLADAHLWACVQSRKSGVLSLEWEIDRGKAKSRNAKVIRDIFDSLDIYKLISDILDSILWGFQPLEVLWKKSANFILPADIVAKPPEWFVFDDDNNLKFRTKSNWIGEALPEKKFLLPQYNASYQNPYGERVLSKCFWPITFKKGGLKFWLIFTEKYGMPFLIGHHPRGSKQEEVDSLADKLELMIQDAIAVIPDDSSVEFKDFGGRSASAQIYEKLVNWSNAEISKAILGQTLTTEVGATGSYAASKTHFMVRQDIVDADQRMVQNILNQLIRWIYDINFAGGEVPKFTMWQEEDVNKDLAVRDKTLTESGVQFNKEYFQRAYGFAADEFDLHPLSSPAPQFAEFAGGHLFPDQQALDNAIDSTKPQEL